MGMSPDNRSTAAITRMGLLAALAALSPATGVATAGMSRVVGIASAAELIDAVEQAQPGDLIEVADGEYSLASRLELSAKGTAAEPIIIRARHRGRTVLTGAFEGIWLVSAAHVTVEGSRSPTPANMRSGPADASMFASPATTSGWAQATRRAGGCSSMATAAD